MTEHQTKATEAKVEVKVGPYDEGGRFLGEVVRSTGEEVGGYREKITGDTRGTDYTLYECPGAGPGAEPGYRVLEENWSRWQGEGSRTRRLPNDAEDDPEYGRPVRYGVYTETEARGAYPELFAALGDPNVVDLP